MGIPQDIIIEFLHEMPEDIEVILEGDPALRTIWESLTPLSKNEWICWVTIVKKPETRSEHLMRMREDLKAGKRRPCCWPGCPHRRPSAAKYF